MTSPRRPRAWADFHLDLNLSGDTRGAVNLLVNATVNLDTITVVRLVGRIRVIPSVIANSTVSAQLCTIGIGVSSTEAFTAAGLTLPDPNNPLDAPPRGWIFKDQAVLVNQQDSGTVEAWEFPEFKFDNRAMRKIDRGILFMQMDNIDLIAGTTAVKFVGLIRALCLT